MFAKCFLTIALISALVPFVLFFTRGRQQELRVYIRKCWVLMYLSGVCFITGFYVTIVADLYQYFIERKFPQLHVCSYEGEYFAMQTFLTVGYGIHLCSYELPKDPNSALTRKQEHDLQCELREKFRFLANLSMLILAPISLVALSILIDYVRRIFRP